MLGYDTDEQRKRREFAEKQLGVKPVGTSLGAAVGETQPSPSVGLLKPVEFPKKEQTIQDTGRDIAAQTAATERPIWEKQKRLPTEEEKPSTLDILRYNLPSSAPTISKVQGIGEDVKNIGRRVDASLHRGTAGVVDRLRGISSNISAYDALAKEKAGMLPVQPKKEATISADKSIAANIAHNLNIQAEKKEKDSEKWAKENPIKASLADAAGSLPPTLAELGMFTETLGPVAGFTLHGMYQKAAESNPDIKEIAKGGFEGLALGKAFKFFDKSRLGQTAVMTAKPYSEEVERTGSLLKPLTSPAVISAAATGLVLSHGKGGVKATPMKEAISKGMAGANSFKDNAYAVTKGNEVLAGVNKVDDATEAVQLLSGKDTVKPITKNLEEVVTKPDLKPEEVKVSTDPDFDREPLDLKLEQKPEGYQFVDTTTKAPTGVVAPTPQEAVAKAAVAFKDADFKVEPTKYRSVGAAGKDNVTDVVPLYQMPEKPITVRTASGQKATVTPKPGEVFSVTPTKTAQGKIKYELHDGVSHDIPKNVAQDLINKYGVKQQAFGLPEGLEVVKKGGKLPEADPVKHARYKELIEKGRLEDISPQEEAEFDKLQDEVVRSQVPDTKYSKYSLPNATNYREVLLKAPEDKTLVEVAKQEYQKALANSSQVAKDVKKLASDLVGREVTDFNRAYDILLGYHNGVDTTSSPELMKQVLPIIDRVGKARRIMNDAETSIQTSKHGSFKSPHWDELDVVAHLRAGEHKVPERIGYQDWQKGKQPSQAQTTLLEEIQSDWARSIREAEKGKPKYIAEPATNQPGNQWWVTDTRNENDTGRLFDTKAEAEQWANKNQEPSHPALKDWQTHTLKHAIKEAVDAGSDSLSWVTGQQTAERYDLSKHVSKVLYNEASKQLVAYGTSGDQVINVSVEPAKIADYVGKDVAEKLMKQKTETSWYVTNLAREGTTPKELWNNNWAVTDKEGRVRVGKLNEQEATQRANVMNGERVVSGLDLKTDSPQWAINLYDKQIPNILKDLTKGYGTQFKDITLENGETVHSMTITPSLREAVLGDRGTVGAMSKGGKADKPVKETDLEAEARKYKTAEEFANNTGKQEKPSEYINNGGYVDKFQVLINKKTTDEATIKPGDEIIMTFAGGPTNFPKPWTLVKAYDEYSSVSGKKEPIIVVRASDGQEQTFDHANIYTPRKVAKNVTATQEAKKLTSEEREAITQRYAKEYPELHAQAVDLQQRAIPKQEELNVTFDRVASELGLKDKPFGNVKSVKSLVEKVLRKQREKPDYTIESIKDPARGTILIEDYTQVPAVVAKARDVWSIKAAEATLDKPLNVFGYRGIHLNADLGEGINGEIQLHTKESWAIKEKSDAIYQKWRNYSDEDINNLSPQERDAYERDIEKSNKIYEDFWATIPPEVKARASASVMGLESVITPSFPSNSTQALPSQTKGMPPPRMGAMSNTRPLAVTENRTLDISLPPTDKIAQGGEEVKGILDSSQGKRERGFVTSVKEAIPEADKVAGEYIPRDTDRLAIRAFNFVREDLVGAENLVRNGELNDKTVATAAELIKYYNRQAKENPQHADMFYQKVADIANPFARKLTEAGRTVQAASILARQTPEGQLRFAAREIQAHNEKVKDQRGGLLGLMKEIPELTKNETKYILNETTRLANLPDGIEKAMGFQKLYEHIGARIPTPLYDKIIAFWKAGLLTGMKTSGVNMFSNLSHGVTEVAKDIPAVMVDKVASLFTGKRTVAFTTKGGIKGTGEGFKKGWQFLKTGFDERNMAAKYDYKKVNYVDPTASPAVQKTQKVVQAYVDTVFRVLGTEDQLFFYGARARSMFSQAYAEAKNAIKRGEIKKSDTEKFVDNLVQHPTEQMVKNAVNDAEIAVFQNKTFLGKAAKQVQRIPVVGQFAVPFTNTPAAVAMQVMNYSPFGFINTLVQNIGKGRFDQRNFSHMLGRNITGTALYVLGAALFTAGYITLTQPTTEKEKKLWEAEGRKPGTIKIGDKYHNIGILGPAGFSIIAGAAFRKGLDETGSISEAFAQSAGYTAKTITEQSFLRGMNAFSDAINDPGRYSKGLFKSLIGSTIPTIIGNIAQAKDPLERRTPGWFDAAKAKIPGLRKTLEPKIDILGRDVTRGSNILDTMANPARPSKDVSNQVVRELRALWQNGYKPALTQLGDAEGFEALSPAQNTKMWRKAGEVLNYNLDATMNSPEYAAASDADRVAEINRLVQQSNKQARMDTFLDIIKDLKGPERDAKIADLWNKKFLNQTMWEEYNNLENPNENPE